MVEREPFKLVVAGSSPALGYPWSLVATLVSSNLIVKNDLVGKKAYASLWNQDFCDFTQIYSNYFNETTVGWEMWRVEVEKITIFQIIIVFG